MRNLEKFESEEAFILAIAKMYLNVTNKDLSSIMDHEMWSLEALYHVLEKAESLQRELNYLIK